MDDGGGLVLILIFWIIFAIAIGVGASSKGREGFVWGFMALIFSPLIVGIFLLVSSDLKPAQKAQAEQAESKACPRCAETVKQAALVCRFCGHEFPAATAEPAVTNEAAGYLG